MNYNELIDRYVYAVTRQLPAKQREDIEKELRSIINDMLEERCGDITPTERDVNVVLAELGKPSELAAKYDPNGERSLIGPRYYRRYIQTLKITLPMVALGLAIAAVLSVLFEGMDRSMNIMVNGVQNEIASAVGSWAALIGEWIGNIITSVFTAAAFITLVFAIFEYKGVTLDEDDITKLPKVPEKNHRIKRAECVVGIVLSVFFLALFTLAPQVICGATISGADGTVKAIPIFDTAVVRSMWPWMVALFMMGVGRECFGLIEGVYSVRYAVVTAVTNILSAVCAVACFGQSRIMNSEFVANVETLFKSEPDAEFLTALFERFNVFFVGIWLLALVINTVEAVVKAIRYKKSVQA